MLSLAAVLAATGGRLEGSDRPLSFAAVSTDSRHVPAGSLFVCLVGERFDGHAFAAAAEAAGAAALVVRADWAGTAGVPLVRVEDTLLAYGHIARAHRRDWGGAIVAVTGSSGKTSTKEMIAAYLSAFYGVHKTEANHNNEVGVPLTLLGLSPAHGVGVVEMGMRGRGQIAYLAELAEPDVGVVTNMGVAHIELLGSVEAIAETKAELWHGLVPGGTAVVPFDDPRARAQAARVSGPILSFSLTSREADVWAEPPEPVGPGQRFVVHHRDGASVVSLPQWGDHHRANALAAIAAGLALGVTPGAAIAIVPERLAGRSREVEAGGVTLIDDSYNANPDSMRAALKAFAETPARGRRFAVLGDMGELGEVAVAAHREVGAYAATLGLDGVIGVGALACHYGGTHLSSPEAACAYLAGLLRSGDRVLFKASRMARFERLVASVTENLAPEAVQ